MVNTSDSNLDHQILSEGAGSSPVSGENNFILIFFAPYIMALLSCYDAERKDKLFTHYKNFTLAIPFVTPATCLVTVSTEA